MHIPYFLEKTLRLLFILVPQQCDAVCLRVALIRGQRLILLPMFRGNIAPSTFILQFPADAMKNLFPSTISCLQDYMVARHRRATKAREKTFVIALNCD